MGCDWYYIYSAAAIGMVFESKAAAERLMVMLRTLQQCQMYRANTGDEYNPDYQYVLVLTSSIRACEISVPGPYEIDGSCRRAHVVCYDHQPSPEEQSLLENEYRLLTELDETLSKEYPPCQFLMLSATSRDDLNVFNEDYPEEELVLNILEKHSERW